VVQLRKELLSLIEKLLSEALITILCVQLLIGGRLRNATTENAVGAKLLRLIWFSFIAFFLETINLKVKEFFISYNFHPMQDLNNKILLNTVRGKKISTCQLFISQELAYFHSNSLFF